jgi:hypothetical protein
MLWNKGAALVNGGRTEEAARTLKSYIEKSGDGGVPDRFYANGFVAARNGNTRVASYYLETALLLAPDHGAAREARKFLESVDISEQP